MLKKTNHASADSRKETAMLTIFELAAHCRISWQDLRDLLEMGNVPAPIVVGNWLRFRKTDIARWESCGCPTCDPPAEADLDQWWDCLLQELKIIDERNQA
jgi:hypothetical protein